MTLESKIQERVKAIAAEQADKEKAALTADQQAQKDFEAANKQLVELVKAIGVKGEITAPKYGESSIPYASFTVLDVPVALEYRSGILSLLVNNENIAPSEGLFSDAQDDLKEALAAVLTEAAAQAVADRPAKAPTPNA